MFRAVCVSGIGGRPSHEDNFLLNGIILDPRKQEEMPSVRTVHCQSVCGKKVNIIAVSDGMGGHNAGEAASRFCVQKLAEVEKNVQNCQSIQEAVERIHDQIVLINQDLCCLSRADASLSGMGATAVIFVSFESEYAILNIGDSRAYGFFKGNLVQLTKDHTEGQRMLDLGILTRKELETFPARKRISRYFGYGDDGFVLQADVYYPKMNDGILMLCSDGVSDALSEQTIEEILSEERVFRQADQKEECQNSQSNAEQSERQNLHSDAEKTAKPDWRAIAKKALRLNFHRSGKKAAGARQDCCRGEQNNAEPHLLPIGKKIVEKASEFPNADNATVILIEI